MKTSVRIEVPERLKKLLKNPTPAIEKTIRIADKEALFLLRDEISKEAAKKSGDLADSVEVDLSKRKVFTEAPHAKAVELGHYASPKYTPKRMFLKFTEMGKDIFIKFVRTEKQPFFFPTESKNRSKVINIYEKAFARMLDRL